MSIKERTHEQRVISRSSPVANYLLKWPDVIKYGKPLNANRNDIREGGKLGQWPKNFELEIKTGLTVENSKALWLWIFRWDLAVITRTKLENRSRGSLKVNNVFYRTVVSGPAKKYGRSWFVVERFFHVFATMVYSGAFIVENKQCRFCG